MVTIKSKPNYYEHNFGDESRVFLNETSDKILLNNIDFDLVVEDSEIVVGAEWPPSRFNDRNAFFELLELLYEGGWPKTLDFGPNPVLVNLFEAYITRLANLLTMSEPTMDTSIVPVDDSLNPIGQRNTLLETVYDCLVSMVKFGGMVAVWYKDGIVIENPVGWYPSVEPGKHHLFSTYHDPARKKDSDSDNVLSVTTIGTNGGQVRFFNWLDGKIGDQFGYEEYPDLSIVVVPRAPRRGIFGTSKFVAMYSPALEISRRYSRNSDILDASTGPKGVVQASQTDIDHLAMISADDSNTEKKQKRKSWLKSLFFSDVIAVPETVLGVQYLQPSVQGVPYALTQSTDIREQLRDITGLPDLSGQTVSGDALKRIFVHFYAETAALQLALTQGLERLTGAPIDWPHVFDTQLFAAEIMSPPTQPNENDNDNDA